MHSQHSHTFYHFPTKQQETRSYRYLSFAQGRRHRDDPEEPLPPPPRFYHEPRFYKDEYIQTLTLDDYYYHRENARNGVNEVLFSDEFNHEGYQLCLLLCPNGLREARGRFLSVYFQVLEGPNDESLVWPVKFYVKFILQNRMKNEDHYICTLPKNKSIIQTPAERGSTFSRGVRRFFPLDLLEPNYLVDDTISVQVAFW
uniref:MATH domain-containing protein n=1 Tax=Strigamia maritima TaxID=126957 RepID=T1IVF1_STRMM